MQEYQLQKITPELIQWDIAKKTVVPWLQAVDEAQQNVPALTNSDMLLQMVTARIKMTLACYYNNTFMPLNTNILQDWAISFASLRLAMEENMGQLAKSVCLKQYNTGGLIYYSIHCVVPYFNSLMPFYAPMQKQLIEFFGSEFYFSVPERKTAVLFSVNQLHLYERLLRDDIYLTHQCSSHALSPELVEVSHEGTYPIC